MSSPVTAQAPATFSASLRRRAVIEVVTLAIATPMFILLAPHSGPLYVVMAALFLVFVGLNAREIRTAVWTGPLSAGNGWCWYSARSILLLTALVVAVFFGWYLLSEHEASFGNMLLTIAIYLPWALVQETIFLFYLLGRLRVLFPATSPVALSAVNGTAYGAVHWPDPWVGVLAALIGAIWAYSYFHHQRLLPIAVSHAVLGATFYYLVVGRDLFSEFLALI
ncbi:MAG: CPBP family intramembrane metalloprotease [Pseudomonadota bacterium]|nr:MAG: CPBP family intramembrane metalloprotease [Pseudomonadota bacterium]